MYTDFLVPSAVTPEDEAQIHLSKKNKQLRLNRLLILNDTETEREYPEFYNTSILAKNLDKVEENYTEPSFKITTTQEEVGFEGQGSFLKKIITDHWENFGEEDKNLSVRLSDKRTPLKISAQNTKDSEASAPKDDEIDTLRPSKQTLETGMIAQKTGEDEDLDEEPDEGETESNQRDLRDLRDANIISKEYLQGRQQLLKEERLKSHNDRLANAGYMEEKMLYDKVFLNDKDVSVDYEPRASFVQEEADSSLVHVNPFSDQSSAKRRLYAKKYMVKGLQDEIRNTDETLRKYGEHRNGLQDNISTVVKHPTALYEDLNVRAPFAVSNYLEKSNVTIQESMYKVSDINSSDQISSEKEQTHPPVSYEDLMNVSGKAFLTDQDKKGIRIPEEAMGDYDLKVLGLSKNRDEIQYGSFSGTFGNPLQQELAKINLKLEAERDVNTSRFPEEASMVQERYVSMATSNNYAQNDLYKEKVFYPHSSNNKTEHWESVQKDVQKLVDMAYKPRASLLDTIINSSKGDIRKSAVHSKPMDNWREQLGKRSEYTNPFAEGNV